MSDKLKNELENINYYIETEPDLEKLDLGLSAKSWKELLDYKAKVEESWVTLSNENIILKEQLKYTNNIIDELEKNWKEQQEYYRYRKDNRYRTFLSKNLEKIKELKGE